MFRYRDGGLQSVTFSSCQSSVPKVSLIVFFLLSLLFAAALAAAMASYATY